MIFVCLGTQIFQLNRLLIEIDKLIENGVITQPVFAQIGRSDYRPKHYEYKDFISPNEFQQKIEDAELIITHGGVGAIVKALKANKQIIAIPRLLKYNEHENDHQTEIVKFFYDNGYIYRINEVDELEEILRLVREKPINKRFVSDGHIIEIVDNYIMNDFFGR